MSRLSDRFALLRSRGQRALITFLTAGDPDLETSGALILAMAEAGADVIEIGVPFSDPVAEGPTIQRSSERALAGGTSLRRILGLVSQIRPALEIPLVLMGYANPFFAMGPAGFARAARQAGVDGVIVADLPPEEGRPFFEVCREQGIEGVLLAAPTTSRERLAMLMRETQGFLYYVSLTGVTGAREGVAAGIERCVRTARELGDVPICVGFGISTPEHVREVGRYADGVVVGSAIVDRITAADSRAAAVDSVASFVAELKAGLTGL